MTLGEYLGAGSGTTKLLLHLNGNSTDSSGNANNGTDTAITYSQANGKFGQGAGLAVTSYSTIPTQTYFNLQSAFTISAWIYQKSNGTGTSYEENILSKDDGTTNNRSWHFFVRGPADTTNKNKLKFVYNLLTDTGVYSSSTIPLNTWTNVMIVSTAGTYTFYINGVASDSGSTNITPAYQGTAPLRIGLYPQSIYTESLPGNQDEVIIENTAWTPQQVQKYYSQAQGRYATL